MLAKFQTGAVGIEQIIKDKTELLSLFCDSSDKQIAFMSKQFPWFVRFFALLVRNYQMQRSLEIMIIEKENEDGLPKM